MTRLVLQTPIPTQESEALVAVVVLCWVLVILLSAHRFNKVWKTLGDVVSFLVYFLGLIFLEILML